MTRLSFTRSTRVIAERILSATSVRHSPIGWTEHDYGHELVIVVDLDARWSGGERAIWRYLQGLSGLGAVDDATLGVVLGVGVS